MSAFEVFAKRAQEVCSLLCIGLDPHKEDLQRFRTVAAIPDTVPDEQVALEFCRDIIRSTFHVALCFKPNVAFFEALGSRGIEVLEGVCQEIIDLQVPIILDAKRGDIGSTAAAYADAAFRTFGATALTVNPYMGGDTLRAFLTEHPDKALFVLCKTSNLGSSDIQTLHVNNGEPLYLSVARLCRDTDPHRMGLVVGATDCEAVRRVRSVFPETWILAPGVGVQGGDLDQTLAAGLRVDGMGLIINVSRSVARATDKASEAKALRDEIWRAASA